MTDTGQVIQFDFTWPEDGDVSDASISRWTDITLTWLEGRYLLPEIAAARAQAGIHR